MCPFPLDNALGASIRSVDSLYTQLKPFTYKPSMIIKAEYQLVVDIAPRLTFSRRDSHSLGLGRGLSVRGGHMRGGWKIHRTASVDTQVVI